jgi:hypothetical protein
MLRARDEGPAPAKHWVGAACFLLVVGLSSGITSVVPVSAVPRLVASLQSGLRRGVIALAVLCCSPV